MSKPKFNLEYPELSANVYGPAISNDDCITVVDPVSFILAQAFLTKQSDLANLVRNFNREDLQILEPERKYQIRSEKSSKEGFEKNRIKLHDFSPEELVFSLEQRLNDKGGHKIWWGSPERAIAKKTISLEFKDIYSGGINFHGLVSSKEKGFHLVKIKYPFTSSKEPLKSILCNCKFSERTQEKYGPINLYPLDFHAALLLRFSEKYQDRIPGFAKQKKSRGKLKFFVPFNEGSSDLMIETLIAKYMANMSNPEIAKKLLQNQQDYSSALLNLLRNGKANFLVIQNKDYTNAYQGELLQFHRNIIKKLEDSRFGPDFDYVYEKKGTDYETVALNFERRENGTEVSERIITKGGPPLIIVRKAENGSRDIFSEEVDDINPWEELYLVKEQTDDKTRRKTSYQVRLPIHENIFIPEPIYRDYITALKHHFKGNLGQLQKRLYAALKAEKPRISEKQFKKISRMINYGK